MTYLAKIGSVSFLMTNLLNLKDAKKQAQYVKYWRGLKGKTIVRKISVAETNEFLKCQNF